MIYLDTNIFIYLFEVHPGFTEKTAQLLARLEQDNTFACSTLSLTECLAQVTPISHDTFLALPKLHIAPLDEKIAVRAGQLQRDSKLHIGDAIHLATALELGCTKLLTNDLAFAKIARKHLEIVTLADA